MSETKLKYTKKLSILVPSYNVEKYILECLGSFEKQLTSQCEIIVYDDASTDKTVQFIKNSSIYNNPNFRLELGTKNKGLSYARNKLREMSCGQYIWFFDSDDKILDYSIEKIMAAIKLSSTDIIFFNSNIYYDDPILQLQREKYEFKTYTGAAGVHQSDNITAFTQSLRSGNLFAPSKVYKREIFTAETDFPIGQAFEDISITPLLASLANSIYYIDEPLYYYRQRSGSITSSMKPEDHLKPLRAILDLKKRYERVHGEISEKALTALMGFAFYQFRSAVRTIAAKAPESQKAHFLKEILDTFQDIHRRNYLYVMKACFMEKGFIYCFHITKRIIKAKSIISKNNIKTKFTFYNGSRNET